MKPGQIFAFTDHYVPTTGRAKGTDGMPDAGIRNMVIDMQDMANKYGVALVRYGASRSGHHAHRAAGAGHHPARVVRHRQ